jgi:hypothetical protein
MAPDLALDEFHFSRQLSFVRPILSNRYRSTPASFGSGHF